MIPHKCRKYRAIFDLLFVLKVTGWYLPSVNKATKETVPAEALDQVGTAMPRIIEALETVPLSEDSIHFSKLDIKYGVNSPNSYTKGTSIGLSKGLNTNLQQRGNNQFANDVWQSR